MCYQISAIVVEAPHHSKDGRKHLNQRGFVKSGACAMWPSELLRFSVIKHINMVMCQGQVGPVWIPETTWWLSMGNMGACSRLYPESFINLSDADGSNTRILWTNTWTSCLQESLCNSRWADTHSWSCLQWCICLSFLLPRTALVARAKFHMIFLASIHVRESLSRCGKT